MSLYTRLASSYLFPFHERLKGHDSVRLRRQMEASERWPLERLEALQRSRLQRLLTHAQQHVPYYRDLFRRLGFKPSDVISPADLQQLPFLDKSTIRANLDALKSERAVGLARFNTGGSSGEPLVFFIGRERISHDVAAKWRATRWWGVDIGDPEIVLWGSPIELGTQDRMRQIRDLLLRTRLLPAFDMSPQNVARFIREIQSTRPKMLFGYPSAFAHIALQAETRGIALDSLGIRVAFVTSERLYDHQRELIERVFGCPVANGYGGRDAGFIAHQCPAGGMHITCEDIIVEIVDADGHALPAGTPGEIVVTHLATSDFPFIRYRTGDVGVLDTEPCACGRTLPLLKEIQGRSTDFLVARDGTVMHGLALIYIIRDLPGVKEFKIVQENLSLTRILLVPADGFEETAIDQIKSGVKARLGQEVEVAVEKVGSIPPEASGKYRYVVSRVNTQTQAGFSP